MDLTLSGRMVKASETTAKEIAQVRESVIRLEVRSEADSEQRKQILLRLGSLTRRMERVERQVDLLTGGKNLHAETRDEEN